MGNMIDELTKYRIKVEKDGKSLVDLPGLACLPALLAMPRASLIGMVAAPLLGCDIHLVSEDGKEVDIEETVRKAAEKITDTANTVVETVREEMEKAWQEVSEEDEPEPEADAEEEAAPEDEGGKEPEKAGEDVPVINVHPDDSAEG